MTKEILRQAEVPHNYQEKLQGQKFLFVLRPTDLSKQDHAC